MRRKMVALAMRRRRGLMGMRSFVMKFCSSIVNALRHRLVLLTP